MIGEKLKSLRKEYNLTQIQLANKLNVAQSLLQRWESGKKQPNLITLKKFSNFFNISLDILAFNEKSLQTLTTKDKTLINRLKDFDKLAEQDKEMISNLIASLASKNKI